MNEKQERLNDEKPKRKRISQIIYESATESTAHSIPHIFKRENVFLKVFWIICLLAAMGVCGWMVSSAIIDYFSYDTVSKSETISEIPSVFPTISICSINAFVTNYSMALLESILSQSTISNSNGQFIPTTYDFLGYRYFAGLNARTLSEKDQKKLSNPLEDIMISCSFNLIECNVSEFEWYFDTLHGSCWKFNSGRDANGNPIPDKISTKSGKINGLSLELYVGVPNSINTVSSSTGVHIVVHNKSAKPYYYEGIDLPTGFQGNVAISRSFSSLLEYPYSECRRDIESNPSVLAQSILQTNYTYQQSDCFNSCFQRYLVKKCGCYDLSAAYWPALNAKPCVSFNDFSCDAIEFANFFSQDVKSLCSDECPLECESVVYSVSTSFAEYPSEPYVQVLAQNPKIIAFFDGNSSTITQEALKSRIAQVNVFYSDLSYNSYVELEKTNVVDLVSSVGGTLGLFLGVSFLSFIEFIDLFVQILLVSAQKR